MVESLLYPQYFAQNRENKPKILLELNLLDFMERQGSILCEFTPFGPSGEQT